MPYDETRLVAEVNLNTIVENWQVLGQKSKPAQAAAVVKANAYGHGMVQVAKALSQAGCTLFFTASLNEAILLRQALPHSKIAYFDGLNRNHIKEIKHYNLIPSINSLHQMTVLDDLMRLDHRPIPAILHIDTGMNRLGVGSDEIGRCLEHSYHKAGQWMMIYSHLAHASDPEHPKNSQQQKIFADIIRHLPNAPLSLSATGGIMLGPEYHYHITRPGIGLHGFGADGKPKQFLKPALSLSARVLQIRDVKKGETVGYDGLYTFKSPARIATIAGGYGDGIDRRIFKQGRVAKNGLFAPIIGAVSMDLMVVDITHWPHDHLKVEETLCIIGDGITAYEIAEKTETITYEVLTTLGLRAKVIYT